ncbi:hypothetical protein [Pedobacter psychrotolerans]|nr:hypothetical protein [Pedobacter psychrotolerans]
MGTVTVFNAITTTSCLAIAGQDVLQVLSDQFTWIKNLLMLFNN